MMDTQKNLICSRIGLRSLSMSETTRVNKPAQVNNQGFTLLEVLLVCAIIAVLAAISIPSYPRLTNLAKNSRAKSEIRTIEGAISAHIADRGTLPLSLNDVGFGNLNDPWGQPYEYRPAGTRTFVIPINDDFDLYSLGSDRLTAASIIVPESKDDIIRGQTGGFVGLAEEYASIY